MDLLKLAEAEFWRSNEDRKHPFRLLQLATFGKGYPEIRTVVKREVNRDWTFLFYTDIRTPKVKDIQQNSKVSLHFYHPKKQLQVRLKGDAEILSSGVLFEEHLALAKSAPSVSDYTSRQAPSSELVDDKLSYGDQLHFGLIRVITLEIDVLKLDREGHQRAYYSKNGVDWKGKKLVP